MKYLHALGKDRTRKSEKLKSLEQSENKSAYHEFKNMDKESRASQKKQANESVTPPSTASMAKSLYKVKRNLPRSRSNTVAVVSKLIGSLTPTKKELMKKSKLISYDSTGRNLNCTITFHLNKIKNELYHGMLRAKNF